MLLTRWSAKFAIDKHGRGIKTRTVHLENMCTQTGIYITTNRHTYVISFCFTTNYRMNTNIIINRSTALYSITRKLYMQFDRRTWTVMCMYSNKTGREMKLSLGRTGGSRVSNQKGIYFSQFLA